MKKNIKIWTLFIVVPLVLVSCVTSGSRDKYFGYNNKPEVRDYSAAEKKVETNSQDEKIDWKNPLAGDYYEENSTPQSVQAVYYPAPMYVPVIVPWWDSYYGWNYYPSPGIYAYYRSGWWWGYDWYSPWYDYYDYFGRRWHHYPHYGYYSWWNRPRYVSYSDGNYSKPKEKSIRTFGPSRGSTYTDDKSGSSSGRSSSRGTYTPRTGESTNPGNSSGITTPSSGGSSNSSTPRSTTRSSGSEPRRNDSPAPSSSPGYSSPSGSPSSGSSGSSSSGSSSSGSSSSGSSSTTERSKSRGK